VNTIKTLLILLLPGLVYYCQVDERNGKLEGVGSNSVAGKVICGAQGWFHCEEDGVDLS